MDPLIYMLPATLLKHLKKSPTISYLFESIDHDHYINMMCNMLAMKTIDSDFQCIVKLHEHIGVTHDYAIEWLRCFKLALTELEVEEERQQEMLEPIKCLLSRMVEKPQSNFKCHIMSIIDKYKNKQDITTDLYDLFFYHNAERNSNFVYQPKRKC